ncbi:hypothetical protein ACHWQZ_G013214 [Mnemiopsis leidyi]
MTQLYIGNLPDDCSEDFLRNRFEKHGKIKEVLLKGKFAFLEYQDSRSAESAIKHEKELIDSASNLMLDVELANKQVKPVKGPVTLHILNLPSSVNWENLKKMLGTVGNLQKAELVDDGEDSKWKRGIVTYDLKEDAQTAIERFHETPFEGTRLQMICPEPGPNSPLKQDKSRSRKKSEFHKQTQQMSERRVSCDVRKKVEETKRVDDGTFPVRLVVPSNMIGAIIGKEGKTIRKITDTTGARVDIHRKDNAHSLKKEITVFGSAVVCNQAIAMILQIMQDERATLSKPQMLSYKSAVLELLVHHNLLIKMFGERYMGLVQLMERTKTEITITQSDELGKKSSTDRHVNILGSPENCCAAQLEISAMNKDAFEVDMARIYQITQAGNAGVVQNGGVSQQRSPGQYMGHVNSRQSQINQHRNSLPKIRYSPETPVQNNIASSPTRPPQQLSPNAILRLLSDLHGKNLNDYQREQMVLAGQLAHDYMQHQQQQQNQQQQQQQQRRRSTSNAEPSIDAFSQQQQQQQQQQHFYPLQQSSPQTPINQHQREFRYPLSTPKQPVHQDATRSPYLENVLQGYSPYPTHPFDQRSPAKHARGYPVDYENLNMASLLEDLEDIIGSHDGSCDSGIQASPQAPLFQPNYGKQARAPHWQTDTDLNRSYNSQLNYSYLNGSVDSSYNSPEANISGYNGLTNGSSSYKETSDFLSNSLLHNTGSQWSDPEDSFFNSGSFTIENSNLRREKNSELAGAGKSYFNQVHGTQTSLPNQNHSGTYSNIYGDGNTGLAAGNIVEWNTTIPLYVGQKIDAIKPKLEQITQTKIDLRQSLQNEKLVNLKSAGAPDGIQLQYNIQMACKEALNVM